jgi:hypothetical protein
MFDLHGVIDFRELIFGEFGVKRRSNHLRYFTGTGHGHLKKGRKQRAEG